MKDWDPPLLNRPVVSRLLSTDLFARETARLRKNHERIEGFRRVAELRRSCGVEPELVSVNVRIPPRYSP